MKNFPALLTLVLSVCFSLHAAADDKVEGSTWLAESVSGVEPADGSSLKLEFTKILKLTFTLAGESQSWQYGYSVTDGQLILEPLESFGEPNKITYDIKFDEGKLLLLSPKPEPAKEEAETEGEGEPKTEAEDTAETEAQDTEAKEAEAKDAEAETEVEEEDTRVPVWVLIKA